jgi:DNA-binding CsgD family transcriptional regulator
MPRFEGEAQNPVLRPPAGLVLEASPSSADEEVVLSFPLETRPTSHPRLTPAEGEVLEELLLGSSNAEIATRRGVAVRTVANQLAGLFRKLGVHSRLEAARVAAERMSKKTPRAVNASAHTDSPLAQVSGRSDRRSEKVTLLEAVDRMGY